MEKIDYFIREFNGQTDGSTGWDVVERTAYPDEPHRIGREVVVVPCDSLEEAQEEKALLEAAQAFREQKV